MEQGVEATLYYTRNHNNIERPRRSRRGTNPATISHHRFLWGDKIGVAQPKRIHQCLNERIRCHLKTDSGGTSRTKRTWWRRRQLQTERSARTRAVRGVNRQRPR